MATIAFGYLDNIIRLGNILLVEYPDKSSECFELVYISDKTKVGYASQREIGVRRLFSDRKTYVQYDIKNNVFDRTGKIIKVDNHKFPHKVNYNVELI